MPDFDQLSHRAQVRRLRGLAAQALARYDLGGPVRFKLQLHLANTTFRVKAADGALYVLRVCQPDYRTLDELRSEALWLTALRQDTDLGVPEPVPTPDGAYVTVVAAPEVPEPRACMLFRWLDGAFIRKRLMPRHLYRVGALTAHLHAHSQSYTPPEDFSRPCFDVDMLLNKWLVEEDAATQAAIEAAVSLEDRALFYTAADRIRSEITALGVGPDRFGLIHTDLHHGNYLFHNGAVRAIDFDDCGFEHYVYDLATTLWALQGRPRLPAYQEALFEGYRSVRPLPPGWDTHLTTFIAARYLIVTYYVVGRSGDNPNIRQIAPHYVRITSDYVRQYMNS